MSTNGRFSTAVPGAPGAGILLATAALAATPPAAAELQTRSIAAAGEKRSYLLVLPDERPPGGRLPLVVVLHGGGMTADTMRRYTGFDAIAAREGFAVAYPYGTRGWWNDGRLIDGRGETDADDVGFVRALVGDIDANAARIDFGRVFATGISNGGFMSLRLACEAADLFAAVAAVAATMPAELGERCKPARPVSVLVINGTADWLVPYAGGHARTLFSTRGAIWSTDRTVALWARHNGCVAPESRALTDRNPNDGSRVTEIDYRGCARAAVKLLRVESGGHTWPGALPFMPAPIFGATNQDIDASETIRAFFASVVAR